MRERAALAAIAVLAGVRALAGDDPRWLGAIGSWLGLMAMLPLLVRAARAIRPPRFPWPAVPLAHLPLSMLYSFGHIAIALAIRKVAAGGRDPWTGGAAELFRHGYRLDLPFYACAVAALLLAWRRS